jgi:hypothetical protein
MPICRLLLMHYVRSALDFARDSTGNSKLARMAMIAMTTNSSISVNAICRPIEAGETAVMVW